jgi:hypothetical protein
MLHLWKTLSRVSTTYPIYVLKDLKQTRIYRGVSLPVVFHRFETRSLTLREEHKLRVFEDRVLRRIFGPKRNEVIGG